MKKHKKNHYFKSILNILTIYLLDSKKCNEILENAEKRITILLNENGEIKEESFTAEN